MPAKPHSNLKRESQFLFTIKRPKSCLTFLMRTTTRKARGCYTCCAGASATTSSFAESELITKSTRKRLPVLKTCEKLLSKYQVSRCVRFSRDGFTEAVIRSTKWHGDG